MSVALTVNNTTYFYPEQGDINWGSEATDWAVAVTSGMLQKAGGLFQLLGEVDFGANYGLKSLYYRSRSANVASTGILRLANGDSIDWRNALNTADLGLSVNSLNQLTFNGQVLAQDSSYVNVLDYGAKGDGVTVDSVAIQAALDAAGASTSRKIVYFPNTTLGYVVNTPISVPAGITLLGDNYRGGERSRIKPAPGYTGHIIESKNFTTPAKQNRINIVGLYIDGSNTTLTAINLITQESAIINVTIKNCFTYGIRIGGISSLVTDLALNNLIQGCYLSSSSPTAFFDGIFLDYFCADNTITATYIENCQNACIRSRAANDIIENNHLYLGLHLYYSETSDDKLVDGNYFENSDDAAIVMLEGSGGNLVLNGVISNNTFRNINRAGAADGLIEIRGPNTTALTVSGNTVRRDTSTSYSVPYFVHFDASASALVTTDNTKVYGNAWQSGCIGTAETNIAQTYLSKNGGLLSIGSEVDFGSSFGLKSLYIKTVSSNPASTGVLRLANADVLAWRNTANTNNLSLSVDSSDRLLWNGSIISNTVNTVGTIDSATKSANGAVISGQSIVMQTADATHPGMMSTGAQSIAGDKTFTDKVIVGNAGTETAGLNVNGITLQSTLKVSDINGPHYAQTTLHRHSTVLEPVILAARSNSNTDSHSDVTGGMNLFTIYGAGWAGSNYKLFGSISLAASSSGSISNTSAPGKLVLALTPNSSVSPATVMTIESNGQMSLSGSLDLINAGSGIKIKEGSNAKMGSVALVGGSAVVSTTAVAATSRIFLTSQVDGGTPGFLRVSTRSAGTSFTITSSSGTDTSTVAWMIVDPS